jgi:allophanate hydrolase
VDVLAIPTAATIYTRAAVEAEPLQLNTNLGYYTNWLNLLDGCGLALPAGFRKDGLPLGITLAAPALRDPLLAELGARFQRRLGLPLGATGAPLPPAEEPSPRETSGRSPRLAHGVRLAVVGAHLTGMPLNVELTGLGARLVRSCRTAEAYRLFALAGTVPPKPGLVRSPVGGHAIAVEVWELSPEAFGQFVSKVPAPLCIGTLSLEDGEQVKGFLCEEHATASARDISSFGGWRAYLSAEASAAGTSG